ncbi:putative two-component sensor histidine kinase [Nitrospira sp. KM1]|uniref:sensor histidine kinase n=1 Tax=Nitrospira sp. KM1 TaxID=1936990 RepID=UPI0013A75B67|nr:ATP-binding protein [Nitrospira sp. KM1]BCA55732.1 putative two-component sensor histidine kinase [Nitrospira sp. KM1]
MTIRRGFQVIDGYKKRNQKSGEYLPLQEDGQRSWATNPVNQLLHEGEGLTTALKATEERLTSLLYDRELIRRDLHDVVLQSLYAIGLGIETSRRQQSSVSQNVNSMGDFVVEQLNTLIHEVRGMVRMLESGTVQEFDLSSELQTLISTYRQAARIQIVDDIHAEAMTLLTLEEKQEILKIVREAVSNCVRHAKASRITLSLHTKGNKVRLHILDDGIGFPQDRVGTKGYGLANMVARAKKLGGHLSVRSEAGGGTSVLAEFTLEPMVASV